MARFGAITIPIIATLDKMGFRQAQSAVGKFGKMAIKTLGAVAAAAAAATAKFAWDSINAFSDYNEALNKSNVIFGESAKQIETFAETASSTFGQSARQALDAASSFAGLGKAAGLGGQDLVDFSTTLTVLASDLASFNNTSVEDAIQALGSGLRGEAEPLRRFNVLLNDATLREQALKMGLISTTKEALTPANKTLATYAVILKQTKDAQGDFAATSDGLANSQKTLTASFEDIQRQFGEAIAPMFQKFVDWLKTDGLDGFQAFIDVLTGKEVVGTEWTAKNGKIERSLSPTQKLFVDMAETIKFLIKLIQDLIGFIKKLGQMDITNWWSNLRQEVEAVGTWFDSVLNPFDNSEYSGNGYSFQNPFGPNYDQRRAGTRGGNVNINVNGTVLDPEGTARAIQRVLTQSQRRAGAY